MEVHVPSAQTTLLILLGASAWPLSPEFQTSEAFANAARRLRAYFLNPRPFGLPAENLLDLFDSDKSADELDIEIGQFLERRLADMKKAGNPARDLLLYFVGHGGFVGRDSDFYLAIRRTRMDNPRASGLQMMSLADTLTERARYLRRIIILDCCFAAAAFSAFQAGPDQVALEKTVDAFEVRHKAVGFPTKGTTLLCSSSQKSPSMLLPDGSSTMFTKALLDALVQGTTSQRDRLTLRDVKDVAAELLHEIRNAPRPVVLSPDQSEGDVADIPFFPNPRAEEERTRKAEEVERVRRMEEERLRRVEELQRVRQAEEERRRQAEEVEQLQKAKEQAVSPPPLIRPHSEAPKVPGQQPSTQINQTTAPTLPPQVKRSPNLRLVAAVFFLLATVIGSSIFFFAKSSSNSSPSNRGNTSNGSHASISKGSITVGGKLDTESQLITEMYILLLQKAGYNVTPKLALGNNASVFEAITSGAIDLYPEFTTTGLNRLNISSTHDPQKDYQTVKNGFEQQFHITWLDPAPLNDGYALCTSQTESQKLGATNLSQLAPKVSQLTLATQSDGVPFFDALKATYGFDTSSFKGVKKVDYSIGFTAVSTGAAQVTECYTTDGSVKTKNFVFLDDDKNGFPQFHPAPIVRDSVLQSDPGIKDALNPLAPDLTTDVSISLQQQVATKKAGGMSVSEAVKEVATDFLKSKGLL